MAKTDNNVTIYIISDTHFNDETNNSQLEDFFLFLKTVRKKADKLFLLGDIFDFYFEYNSVIPRYFFDILCELKRTSKAGVDIHYWTGNHDVWLGDFIYEIGIIPHYQEVIMNINGKKYRVEHGNEFISTDFLKLIFTNKLCIKLFSLIPPDIGISVAKFVSKMSRRYSEEGQLDKKRLVDRFKKFLESDIDTVLLGHFHHPFIHRENNKSLVLLGDWKKFRSYGIISKGNIELRRFSQSPR